MCQQEICDSCCDNFQCKRHVCVDETKFSRKVDMKTGLNQNNESEL